MKVTVIGSGAYGKAITQLLLQSKCDIKMWTEQKDTKNILVPEGVKVTNDFKEALEGSILIYCLTGSKFCKSIFENIKPFIKDDQIIILGSKGILEDGTLITELLEKIIPNSTYAVISGPTFAIDIASLEPIGFTLATKEYETFKKVKSSLPIYLEYSSDVQAIEMSGSLKNAYAIGSGILHGYNFGSSTRCLYITRSLQEIENIFKTLGSNPSSTCTLAGIGDLVLTCTSPTSRNFTFGTILALETLDEKKEYLKNNTVEGYENLKSYYQLFKKKNISTPILDCVYNIVLNDVKPDTLIDILLKNEN